MRAFTVVWGCVLAAGCAGARPGKSAPGTAAEKPPAPAMEATDGGAAPAEPAADPEAIAREALLGAWENGSCAGRRYPRTIIFEEGGEFLAEDAVAPCPAGSNCVLPGVINWGGRWSLEGRVVRIEVVPIPDAKAPETTPTDFVILGDAPFSIGERNDKLVCPFQKRQ